MGGERELQIPRLPPDFLSGLVVSVDFMRLSSMKAAYVVVDESSVVGNPEFAPNEQKIKPVESISISSVHLTLNLPQASRLLGMTKGRAALASAAVTEGWTERPQVICDFHPVGGTCGSLHQHAIRTPLSSTQQSTQTTRRCNPQHPGAQQITHPKRRKHAQTNQRWVMEWLHQLDPISNSSRYERSRPKPCDTEGRQHDGADACLKSAPQQGKLHPPGDSRR